MTALLPSSSGPAARPAARLAAGLGLVLVALAAWTPPVAAQVSVAPVALFMEDQNRLGTFYVVNQSADPQEIELSFRFGYPSADSLGHVYMRYDDEAARAEFAVDPYLRAFPRRFVLPPGQTQVVRLTARPPADLPEGYYWTRLVTTSTPQAEALQADDGSGVQAQVVFRLQQVTAVLYKRGDPSTQVALDDVEARVDSGRVVVTSRIERGGNAPFLGRAIVQVYDAAGTLVAEHSESVAAYFSLRRRFEVPLPQTPAPGTYSANVTLVTERPDIPAEFRLPIPPVSESVQFRVE